MTKSLLFLFGVFLIATLKLLQGAGTAQTDVKLELRLVVEKPSEETEELLYHNKLKSGAKQETLLTMKAISFSSEDFKSATAVDSRGGAVAPSGNQVTEATTIAVTLTESAGKRMENWSKEHFGKRIAMVVDGEVLMVPTIMGSFGVHFSISGGFTNLEARQIANKLKAKK